jgi:hypothetical protein
MSLNLSTNILRGRFIADVIHCYVPAALAGENRNVRSDTASTPGHEKYRHIRLRGFFNSST